MIAKMYLFNFFDSMQIYYLSVIIYFLIESIKVHTKGENKGAHMDN